MTGPGNIMDMDEFEQLAVADEAAAEAAKKLELQPLKPTPETVLEGDEVPEELRGKPLKEALQAYKGLKDGFHRSEAERQALLSRAPAAAQLPLPQVDADPDASLTDEQLTEKYAENTLGLVKSVSRRVAKTTEALFAERVAPMVASMDSMVATQKIMAKQRHPDVFERYEAEIDQAVSTLNRSAMTHPGAWDDLASWTWGKHRDELVKLEVSKQLKTAQAAQASSAGAHIAPVSGKSAQTQGGSKLDDLQREVMSKMGVFDSEEEFLKWSGQGPMTIKE